jgi:hypothetical protein
MKRVLLASLGLVVGVTLSFSAEEVKLPVHPKAQAFMRQKLGYSQGILEGLVLEKYELVATNAVLLRNMNLTNVYFQLGNPGYKAQITRFQDAVDALKKSADSKELWPAYENYNRVAQSCLECHQQFRRAQVLKAADAAKEQK